MSNFLSNPRINENDRRNVAFQITLAIREAVTLAQRRTISASYETALHYIHDISKEIYQDIVALLEKRNESELVKLYTQKAQALSDSDNIVLPLDLIEAEIQNLQNLLARKTQKLNAISLEIGRHLVAAEHFRPRTSSEHRILSRDFSGVERLKLNKLYSNDEYIDYRIEKDRYLRLRLLHPDKPEEITGADFIYEQFEIASNRVKFVQMQYKIWKDGGLYFSDKRMVAQLEKMQNNLCGGGFCNGSHGKNYTKKNFRLPYCSAFLRPTTNKLSSNSKLISSGHHLRVCEVLAKSKTDVKLDKEAVRKSALSQRSFEDLFYTGKLGSRWIAMDDLQDFYKKINLPFHNDTIRIHAQEINP